MYLKLHAGDSRTYDLTITDADGDTPALADIAEVWFTVRADDATSDDIALTMTDGDITLEEVEPEESGGEVTLVAHVTLEPEDSEELAWGSYGFDLQTKDDAGIIYTPIHGRLRVTSDVTTAIS